MDGLLTAELRWFFEGAPAPELLAAFTAWGADEEQRTDHYRCFTSAMSVGIKLREGRLEVKARMHAAPVSLLSDQSARGVEEWWEKQLVSEEAKDASQKGTWLAVRKNRMLLRAAEQFDDGGVSLELTRLAVEDHVAWTIGFEAVGSLPAASHSLLRTAEDLLPKLVQVANLEALCVDRSMSYPEWLLCFRRAAPIRSESDTRSAG